ncbi:TerB family tellurite resistance protein [Vibrio parahaemolyticus]|uniref:tellurite resistance TerB family protein n=1 Tax=Vibrio parahaemolyticus TaxID=670 RepID=UPI0003F9B0A7|nr:TerB family tellurite resistance protein [Vibrio parahaemolyticus]EHR1002104.1 TerB family tellurite resistance protein [Vibrio parahaemolyticus]EII3293887.1 TerB family tellurite resistance protein [Vibrio parahaemolyticus]EII3441193.1 TerB family tellurite resistance protein [Vibrio parahaemolyticus]EIU6861569.1 TerB family tellurite resistance protein [Vibrio parahaemolyticus]EIU7062124.1 TerB family tellurite resistance protein [Vibrio parahaemolyticus]
MSFWKVLGGVAVGVGAVAAAPFTGGGSIFGAVTLAGSLAGAGTVTAAIGAGAVGAAVGAAMDSDDDIKKKAYRDGKADGIAENAAKLQQLENKLKQAVAKLKDSADYYDTIYAMEAVALAVAHCDGSFCDDERKQIDEFIAGVASSSLPNEIKQKLTDMYESPLNIREAFELVKRADLDLELVDEIIDVVIHADDHVHENESAFIQAWNEMKSVA